MTFIVQDSESHRVPEDLPGLGDAVVRRVRVGHVEGGDLAEGAQLRRR